MSRKSSSESRKTSFKIFTLQLLWIGFFIILILGGLSDLILFYDIKRMVLNIFIILSGIISLLAEAYCFKFYSYMLFIYTPIGRGLFMAILSCLNLNDNLYSIIISSILFFNSMIYLLISVIFGGINKPLFNSSLKHELNLRALIYFINNSNITKYTSKTTVGHTSHSNSRRKHIHDDSISNNKSESHHYSHYHAHNNHHRSHHKHHDNNQEDYHHHSKLKHSNHKINSMHKSINNHQDQEEIINLG
ncbi:COPI associated [Cryptosporidium sp. chipmunk genotype I]|uniref:COPI associated n=1 Tax=Cryptosporidium sp. chipmunk genotype I TaxID=1280935 RepID=UPI00351AABF4|nr:COPI associated [Cryptosporidium sp. chipmunk genotype I]